MCYSKCIIDTSYSVTYFWLNICSHNILSKCFSFLFIIPQVYSYMLYNDPSEIRSNILDTKLNTCSFFFLSHTIHRLVLLIDLFRIKFQFIPVLPIRAFHLWRKTWFSPESENRALFTQICASPCMQRRSKPRMSSTCHRRSQDSVFFPTIFPSH